MEMMFLPAIYTNYRSPVQKIPIKTPSTSQRLLVRYNRKDRLQQQHMCISFLPPKFLTFQYPLRSKYYFKVMANRNVNDEKVKYAITSLSSILKYYIDDD